jgi:hypothetical protein
MEKRRTLYTQPTIEASTKSYHEKSLAASWFVGTKDLFIEPLQLTKIGGRIAINTTLDDRDVDSTTSITYTLKSTVRLPGCVRK